MSWPPGRSPPSSSTPDSPGGGSPRRGTRGELDAASTTELGVLTDAEVYAMIDSLGDVGNALNSANSDNLRNLYEQLRLN